MNAEKPDRLDITICMGSSCFARGNGDNLGVIEDYLKENGMAVRVNLAGSRCEGFCVDGPALCINDRRFAEFSVGYEIPRRIRPLHATLCHWRINGI